MGFGKYGAKTYQEVLQMDHEYCRWIDQVEDQQSHWKLKRFSTWLKMLSVFQETIMENKMARRTRQLKEEKRFAEILASKELDKSRKTPKQKAASSMTILEKENLSLSLAEGTSPEVDGQNTTTDDVFARAWGGEFGRELYGMADTCGETTTSALSNEETSYKMSWKEKQVTNRTTASA